MTINKKTLITYIIATLVVGFFIGWLAFSGKDTATTEEHDHITATDDTIWTCSMHPQIRQSEPGNCPICGMDLIPLEQEEESTDVMATRMSPTAMQLADVSTAIVGTMAPEKAIRLSGKVQQDERLSYSQSTHLPGRIERLTVNFTGEYIRKGQPLAYIYSPELVTAQEELFEAYKIRETQPRLYEAARKKLKNWKLTESQIDQIIQSGNARDEFPILADVSGYVTEKFVNLGDYVQRGTAIYEIADLSKVWVLFDVYESDLSWISKGDNITFTIQSLPGKEFQDKISFIDPVIDPQTRVAQARVEMANENNQLKPEMFSSGVVRADLAYQEDAVVIPKSAVMWTGQRSVVYVKTAGDIGSQFIMREVTLGPALGESFVVKEGLAQGEEIAVSGTFSIDAAAQLAGKPSMMNREGAPAMRGHDNGSMSSSPEASNMPVFQQVDISAQAKEALEPVADNYLSVKNALVEDDLKKAKKSAQSLLASLEKVNMSLFKGDAHDFWMEQSAALKQATSGMAKSNELEQARQHFITLSNHMILLVKRFNPVSQTLYVQHCPMANKDRGADWLSAEEDIKNPYFGASMLTCGEVKGSL